MDALSLDTLRDIVRRVFPDLQYGGDPDIERYFEFRSMGRLGEALNIYNGPLRARYPVDASRVLLLRLYREHDPRWIELQERLSLDLGRSLAARLGHNIDVLVAPLERADLSNAFKALSAVEALLVRLPAGDDALAFLDRYVQFARILKYRAALVSRARDLVAEYLAMAKSDGPGETDFMARSAAIEERRHAEEAKRRAAAGNVDTSQGQSESYDFMAQSEILEERRKRAEAAEKARYFDLSRIEFSEADKAKIEIKKSIERREDKVLSYCWKYWELVYDPSFERLVFLYSRKYDSQHYAIFKTIKAARIRRSTDDEILTAVSTLLSSSYSYSVSGDLYMQAMWRRLKAKAEAERAAAIEARAEKALAIEAPRTASVKKEVAAPREVRGQLPRTPGGLSAEPVLHSRPNLGGLAHDSDIRSRGIAFASPSQGRLTVRLASPGTEPEIRSHFAESASGPQIRSHFTENASGPQIRSHFTENAAGPEIRSHFADNASGPEIRSHFTENAAGPEIRSRFSEGSAAPEFRSHLREEVERPLITHVEGKQDERTEMLLAARRESSEREKARIEERISSRATKPQETPRVETRVSLPSATRAEITDINEAALAKPAAKKALVQVKGAAARAHGTMLLSKAPRQEAMPAIAVHGGSVSDRIRRLSGKAYDVYREIFIDSIRDSIHRNLLDNQTRPHRFFDEAPNQAEDLIFNFMADHYEDPYLDWESSPQRKSVEELGFNILSINPIIEMWFKKL
jgi:hypothetical protein